MNSNIKIITSYLKGTKTIKGYFPIFVPSEDICNISEKENLSMEAINKQLDEGDTFGLVTQDSNNVNRTFFILDNDSESFYVEI